MQIKQGIETPDAPAPGGAYSQAIMTRESVFTAGQVGNDPHTGQLRATLDEQVETALDNLETVLRAAGCGLEDVVKTTCFLADIDDFAAFNRIYQSRFPAPLPARSTVGVALAGNIRFEIEAVALRPEH